MTAFYDRDIHDDPASQDTKPANVQHPLFCHVPPSEKFSSLYPNRSFLDALLDYSGQDIDAHEEAVEILDAWQPQRWKGQVWCGYMGQDWVWSGRAWEPLEPLPVFVPAKRPSVLVPPAPTSVPVKMVEALSPRQGWTSVTSAEVNQAYEAYELDAVEGQQTLWATVGAFARTRERVSACRRLIGTNPEVSFGVDDIFQDFNLELRRRMEAGEYTHEGKFGHWVTYIWNHFYFKGKKQAVGKYLTKHSFVNNLDPGKAGFRFEKHCVRTSNVSTDLPKDPNQFDGILCKRRRQEDGQMVTFRMTAESLVLQLDNPQTDLGRLEDRYKDMLRAALKGEGPEEAAVRLNISPRHARRLKAAAIAECQKVMNEDDFDFSVDLDGCAEEEDNVICIDAAAEEDSRGLVGLVESYGSAITVTQLAAILQCSRGQIYKLIDEKRLPALRVGTLVRLDPVQVGDWIRSKMTIAA